MTEITEMTELTELTEMTKNKDSTLPLVLRFNGDLVPKPKETKTPNEALTRFLSGALTTYTYCKVHAKLVETDIAYHGPNGSCLAMACGCVEHFTNNKKD